MIGRDYSSPDGPTLMVVVFGRSAVVCAGWQVQYLVVLTY